MLNKTLLNCTFNHIVYEYVLYESSVLPALNLIIVLASTCLFHARQMNHIVLTVHDYLLHYWKRKAITRLWNISRCLVGVDMLTYMLWLCTVNYIYLLTTYRGVNYWPELVGQWGSWRHTSTCKWPIKTMRRLPEITVSSWKIIDHLGKYYCVLKWIIWVVINTNKKNTIWSRLF